MGESALSLTPLIEKLHREGEEIRALGAEHAEPGTIERRVYDAIEYAAQLMLDTVEAVADEIGKAA